MPPSLLIDTGRLAGGLNDCFSSGDEQFFQGRAEQDRSARRGRAAGSEECRAGSFSAASAASLVSFLKLHYSCGAILSTPGGLPSTFTLPGLMPSGFPPQKLSHRRLPTKAFPKKALRGRGPTAQMCLSAREGSAREAADVRLQTIGLIAQAYRPQSRARFPSELSDSAALGGVISEEPRSVDLPLARR